MYWGSFPLKGAGQIPGTITTGGGSEVGPNVGSFEGVKVGLTLGTNDGLFDGTTGVRDGVTVGVVGTSEGLVVGEDGRMLGLFTSVGCVGCDVG